MKERTFGQSDTRSGGRLVAQQPEQIAYSIVDSKVKDHFMPSVFPPIEASSLDELATELELTHRPS